MEQPPVSLQLDSLFSLLAEAFVCIRSLVLSHAYIFPAAEQSEKTASTPSFRRRRDGFHIYRGSTLLRHKSASLLSSLTEGTRYDLLTLIGVQPIAPRCIFQDFMPDGSHLSILSVDITFLYFSCSSHLDMRFMAISVRPRPCARVPTLYPVPTGRAFDPNRVHAPGRLWQHAPA